MRSRWSRLIRSENLNELRCWGFCFICRRILRIVICSLFLCWNISTLFVILRLDILNDYSRSFDRFGKVLSRGVIGAFLLRIVFVCGVSWIIVFFSIICLTFSWWFSSGKSVTFRRMLSARISGWFAFWAVRDIRSERILSCG